RQLELRRRLGDDARGRRRRELAPGPQGEPCRPGGGHASGVGRRPHSWLSAAEGKGVKFALALALTVVKPVLDALARIALGLLVLGVVMGLILWRSGNPLGPQLLMDFGGLGALGLVGYWLHEVTPEPWAERLLWTIALAVFAWATFKLIWFASHLPREQVLASAQLRFHLERTHNGWLGFLSLVVLAVLLPGIAFLWSVGVLADARRVWARGP